MLPSSDLFASGSNDGYIRFWHADLVERSIKEVGKIPANGFVNCLSFSPTGKYLVAGIGREHRLGKWSRQRTRNGVVVVKMPDLGFKRIKVSSHRNRLWGWLAFNIRNSSRT